MSKFFILSHLIYKIKLFLQWRKLLVNFISIFFLWLVPTQSTHEMVCNNIYSTLIFKPRLEYCLRINRADQELKNGIHWRLEFTVQFAIANLVWQQQFENIASGNWLSTKIFHWICQEMRFFSLYLGGLAQNKFHARNKFSKAVFSDQLLCPCCSIN